MSHWTYVSGLIKVRAFGDIQPDVDYAVAKAVDRLPKVTGSEQDMSVTISPIDDVTSCTWGERYEEEINLKEEYYIIVNGNLRDRDFDQTFREFNKFLNRLAKRIWVTDVLVRISSWDRECVINDKNFYSSLSD